MSLEIHLLTNDNILQRIDIDDYDGTNPSSKVNSLQKVLKDLNVTIDWTKPGY